MNLLLLLPVVVFLCECLSLSKKLTEAKPLGDVSRGGVRGEEDMGPIEYPSEQGERPMTQNQIRGMTGDSSTQEMEPMSADPTAQETGHMGRKQIQGMTGDSSTQEMEPMSADLAAQETESMSGSSIGDVSGTVRREAPGALMPTFLNSSETGAQSEKYAGTASLAVNGASSAKGARVSGTGAGNETSRREFPETGEAQIDASNTPRGALADVFQRPTNPKLLAQSEENGGRPTAYSALDDMEGPTNPKLLAQSEKNGGRPTAYSALDDMDGPRLAMLAEETGPAAPSGRGTAPRLFSTEEQDRAGPVRGPGDVALLQSELRGVGRTLAGSALGSLSSSGQLNALMAPPTGIPMDQGQPGGPPGLRGAQGGAVSGSPKSIGSFGAIVLICFCLRVL